jgi:phosphoribosyl 1,2-cyclic phosphodiesterase
MGKPNPCERTRIVLRLHVLASGSRGNASVVEDTATGRGILIDCGISKKAFMEACSITDFDPRHLEAVLITHEHSDHTKGLGVVLRGLAKLGTRPKLYVNDANLRVSKPIKDALASIDSESANFEAEDDLCIAGMRVFPFATSHDAIASFGFRFESDGDVLGFMTDTGVVTPSAHAHLDGSRILALEGNHDPRMLEEGPYPYVIKQRIASNVGHLSNEQGSAELTALLHNDLQTVVAMHVSQNNNLYRLARESFAEALERESHPATALVAYQERPILIS